MLTTAFLSIITAAGLAAAEPTIDLQGPAKRHALLIGVQYTEKSLQLNTKPDVEAMRKLLAKFGFTDSDMVVLDTPESTTKKGIADGFETLIARVEPGDVVLIHYAGHGSQVPDEKPGEPGHDGETDGFDETICPSDVKKEDASGHIRDDKVGEWIDLITKENPKSVVVVFDACHSGSGTRSGNALARRLPKEWAPFADQDQFLFAGPGSPFTALLNAQDGSGMLRPAQRANKGLVFLAAARADQTAYETNRGQDMGAFTSSLIQAFAHPNFEGLKEIPVRQLFDVATTLLHQQHNRLQDPQLEGARDTYFLTNDTVVSMPYYRIEKKPDGIAIDAGSLGMITEGSILHVHPARVIDPLREKVDPIAILKVHRVKEYYSIVIPTVESPKQGRDWTDLVEAGGINAFMSMRALGDTGIKVVVDKRLRGMPEFSKIEAALKRVGVVDVSGDFDPALRNTSGTTAERPAKTEYDVLIAPVDGKPGAIEFRRHDDAVIGVGGLIAGTRSANDSSIALSDPSFEQGVQLALERESRYRFLSNLKNDAMSKIKVKMRIRKVETEPDPEDPDYRQFKAYLADADATAVVDATMQPGDYFCIEVCNVGEMDAYVHVLDLTSDGAVGLLWPFEDIPGATDAIKPNKDAWVPLSYPVAGGKRLPMIYRVGDEEGPEIVKLIAAKEKLRLDGMITRDSARDTKGATPIEELLRLATMGTRQSGPASRLANYTWWSDQVGFTVRRSIK